MGKTCVTTQVQRNEFRVKKNGCGKGPRLEDVTCLGGFPCLMVDCGRNAVVLYRLH